MLVSDGYAPQRAEHVSLHGPTAALLTELLQLTAPDSEMRLIIQSVPEVTKDIFVWIAGPRRSVNHFNCAT